MNPRVSETWAVLSTLALASVLTWLVVRSIGGGAGTLPSQTAQTDTAPTGPPPVVQIIQTTPPPADPSVTQAETLTLTPVSPETQVTSVVQRLRQRSSGPRSYADPSEITTMNNFLWGVYPYLCIVLFFVIPLLRMIFRPFSWTTRSSGLFGNKVLGLASLLLHWGLVLVLVGHVAGLIGGVLGSNNAVLFFYWSGLIGGVSVLLGSILALYRRTTSPQMRAISQSDDYIVHLFIIGIVGLALYQVLIHQIFGMAFTAGSWAASLWTLSPQPELMVSASLLSKLHILLALTFFAYFPFTKLVHFWTFPINYFVRPQISMRTQRYRFQRRWEFAWRSDKSWLTYGLGSVAVVFLISAALLGTAKPSQITGGDVTSTMLKTSTGTWLTGYPLYISQCARCHGVDGYGDGPGANSPTFAAPPRDLVYRGEHYGARYHFVSTDNAIASDDDLYRTISEGLTDSGMPGFPELTDNQILSLIDVLNDFRAEGDKPGNAIIAPADPGPTASLIAAGGKLFQEQCISCHGREGHGDGDTLVFDYLERQLIPADLAAGKVKSTHTPEQLFIRITVGIPGGAGKPLMTPFNKLSEADRWALVHYVREKILPKTDASP